MGHLKVLVLCHEQRSHFSGEPGYGEVLLPLGRLDGVTVVPYVYQRLTSRLNGGRGPATPGSLRDGWPGIRAAAGCAIQRINAGRWRVRDRALIARLRDDLSAYCEVVRPHLIVNLMTWHYQSVPAELLHELRSRGHRVATVFFDHDESNAGMLAGERAVFEASCVNVIADSPLRARRIREGQGVYADWAHRDSAVFAPVPIDPVLFFADPGVETRIGLMGSKEGRRAEVLEHLVRRYPNVYRGGSLLDAAEHLPIDDYARELRRSLMNVVTSTQASRSQIKGRSFQAIAAGTCLVEERNADNASFFDPEGVWFWSGYDALHAAIDDILTHPARALDRARAYSARLHDCYAPRPWLDRLMAMTDR